MVVNVQIDAQSLLNSMNFKEFMEKGWLALVPRE